MLSDLVRYALYEAEDDWVLLEKEITFIKNYVDLQLLRVANKNHVKLNISGEVTSQKVPPLILISFIENAFKHGVDEEGNTKVFIAIDVNADELQFTCRNHMVNANKERKTEKSGIGIQNTRDRLELLYPGMHRLHITRENGEFITKLTLSFT